MTSSDRRLVVFTPYGRAAGSSRVRVYEWIDHLGLDAVVHTFTDGNAAGLSQVGRRPVQALRRHRELCATEIRVDDVVLIHRELSPFSDGRAEERILQAGARGVFDLDDGLQWDWGHGGWARRLRPKSPKVIRMVKAADLVIAGNDLIAEWASQYARCVVVIPSCVDPSRYRQKTEFGFNYPPLVGWIGSAATEKHLRSWEFHLLGMHRETGARLVAIGAMVSDETALNSMTDRIPWTEDTVYATVAEWDLGLMPLPDGLMERAKCAYKLLQYAAAGVPIAASAVGVNAEILSKAMGDSAGELADPIGVLQARIEDRRQSADRAQKYVVDHFSFDSNSSRQLEALSGPNLTLRSKNGYGGSDRRHC